MVSRRSRRKTQSFDLHDECISQRNRRNPWEKTIQTKTQVFTL